MSRSLLKARMVETSRSLILRAFSQHLSLESNDREVVLQPVKAAAVAPAQAATAAVAAPAQAVTAPAPAQAAPPLSAIKPPYAVPTPNLVTAVG